MSTVRYHVAVGFAVGSDGTLMPMVEEAAANPQEAVLLARRLGQSYAGAIAFSRTMDMGQGRYGPPHVHVVEGLIPRELQPVCGRDPKSRTRPDFKIQSRTAAMLLRQKEQLPVVRPARWRR